MEMDTTTTDLLHDHRQAGGEVSSTTSHPLNCEEKHATTVAMELLLPTTIAVHVKDVLTRRGVALDDFVLDLLTRFVPGTTSNLPVDDVLETTSNTKENET